MSLLPLVDRSRIETGTGRCQVERYLGYHFGPSGYGIQRTSESLPLATGIAVHVGTEALGRWALEHPEARTIPLEIIRQAAWNARQQYEIRARARGLAQVGDAERVEYLIGEQSSLIGGLIWCAGLEFFPYLLDRYQVIVVESEEVYVLDCSCGLGDGIGTLGDHEGRDCQGLGFMSRPDLITRSRDRLDSHQYWEYKTTSRVTQAWQESWETRVQFHAGVVPVEQRLGIRIDETFVVGLFKGDRRPNKEGVRQQNSVLCYGYYRAPKPPHQPEGWEALWDDPTRTPQKLAWQTWKKRPIWDVEDFTDGEVQDPVEYWVRWLTPEIRQQQVAIVGPFNRQETLIRKFFHELVPAERRWQAGTWAVYEALAAADFQFGAPEVQQMLGEHFQRSWACRKFGAEHECAFARICFEREGWTDPLAHGYSLRRPHHEPELQQALAAGVIPPDEEVEDED